MDTIVACRDRGGTRRRASRADSAKTGGRLAWLACMAPVPGGGSLTGSVRAPLRTESARGVARAGIVRRGDGLSGGQLAAQVSPDFVLIAAPVQFVRFFQIVVPLQWLEIVRIICPAS